ncbi:hypothetical protein PF010_g32844 [Phytophthora fragariae]|uniref:Uncharacterized protein n=1 Tax=Phytophthora fragariae TaxID=53985 RepID=A0A6A3LEA4_9STRA|nr:hypothetical protein PF011_g7044 [Phytophthora fragariae]KAE9053605.1 hypothetical protein PF010_g32844 [Phytophthora fragariae]KAE9147979.1 hypothetical protein PF006_g7403 [Phytophthora fragariae]KAE9316603.1 hypothetical protein PF001_g7267 [Phytophthora fragariae]
MTSKEYAKMLVEKVFPAIRAKWPGSKRRRIRVQHDNASPHGAVTKASVQQGSKEEGRFSTGSLRTRLTRSLES